MKSGYDQFFKQARANSQSPKKQTEFPISAQDFEKQLAQGPSQRAQAKESFSIAKNSKDNKENQLRKSLKMKKKRSQFSWKLSGLTFIGFALTFYGYHHSDEIEKALRKVEVGIFQFAAAEENPAGESKASSENSEGKKQGEAKASGEDAKMKEGLVASSTGGEEDQFDHLQKLNERKKQLDAREEELNRMEEEMQKQKAELERRMVELKDLRGEISNVLDDRVKADDQKIEILVQMYSNMKPTQAAKIFETMDEDLAVEILGRMKKKNAAEVMNLIKAEKAQVISEKFAGYKRKPAASTTAPSSPVPNANASTDKAINDKATNEDKPKKE